MRHAHAGPAAAPPHAADGDDALRRMLEETQRLALQVRLLALNTAFESGACGGAAGGAVAEIIGHEAGLAAAEAEHAAHAVALILRQIESAAALSKPL